MALEEPSKVSRDVVVAAYRIFLGREPESERVIREKIEHHKSVTDLFREFVNSQEFKWRHSDYRSAVKAVYHATSNPIDVDVPPEVFSRLFARIRDQWAALGESEPFWSVLSDDRFRMSNIENSRKEFYASGADSDRIIDVFCQRSNVAPPTGTCLELGCGVGRVTHFLAKRFTRVIGVDISQGNLDLARAYFSNARTSNVDLILLRDLEQLEETRNFDFFYSLIVLQHNPPPIMARMLRIILKNLRPGGGFLFQIPTHSPGYRFIAELYLESYDPVGDSFEMHVLPMHVVLGIIEEVGGRVKEVLADGFSGGQGSHTFFGVKT